MSTKKRVNLYLTEDLYKRLQAATARIPGLSPSKVIDMGLAESVSFVERLVAAIEAGDRDAALQALQLGLAEANERVGVGIHTIRTKWAEKGEAG
jgi:DNA-binding FadR family transcriptional regulator